MMRAEADSRILAENALCELRKSSLEIGKGNALVDRQALDLVEDRAVGCIDLIGAVDTAGCDHADRDASPLHLVDLNAGGLRAKQHVAIDVERILLVLCRVVRRDVQGFEVVVVLLDLRSVDDFIPHADEDVLDLLKCHRIRMQMAALHFPCRERHIDGLGRKTLVLQLLRDLRLRRCKCLFDLCSRLVHHLADLRAVFRCHRLHPLQDLRELTLFTEHGDPDLVDLIR